jgi:hypothetical protein
MGVGGQRHAPIALPSGTTGYPLYRRLGGPQGNSGWVRELSPLPGFDLRTVQPVPNALSRPILLRVLPFIPVSLITPLLHTHSFIYNHISFVIYHRVSPYLNQSSIRHYTTHVQIKNRLTQAPHRLVRPKLIS